MPDSYTQIYIQLVFAVRNRDALISESFREELQKYLTGIAQNYRHKLLAVYCMPDHAHLFVGLNPGQSISNLTNELKTSSSKWINEQHICKFHFNWQEGFGAFSYHRSMLNIIVQYINSQKEHHKKRSFKEEYLNLLREFDIDFNDQYLFEWID